MGDHNKYVDDVESCASHDAALISRQAARDTNIEIEKLTADLKLLRDAINIERRESETRAVIIRAECQLEAIMSNKAKLFDILESRGMIL